MVTLAIETSCDETSCSVLSEGKVLSNITSSSVHLHASYGGVVPEIASRRHVDYIFPVYQKAVCAANIKQNDIELICVTSGPGLPGSLLVGISFAKALAVALDVPILGVSHLEGHILSAFIDRDEFSERLDSLDYVSLVVSGGHTSIYSCSGDSIFEIMGQTIDDAAGEAFDKAAKVLGLGYPGGPAIEKTASEYDGDKIIDFPRAKLKRKNDLDFSFSGLKTAVLYYWRDCERTEQERRRVSYSFQKAVVGVIIEKVRRVLKRTHSKILVAGGGVVINASLREALKNLATDTDTRLILPRKEFSGDNAAMIAFCGERMYKKGIRSDLRLVARPAMIR